MKLSDSDSDNFKQSLNISNKINNVENVDT